MRTIFALFKFTWRLCLASVGLAFLGSLGHEVFILKIDFDPVVYLGLLLFSIAMMIPFIKYMITMFEDWKYEMTDDSYVTLLATKTKAYADSILKSGTVVKEDYNEREKLLSQFREDYNQFFHNQGKGVRENTPLQNTATQLYWNTLSLQKKRLDKKGITMSLEAKRMNYGESTYSVIGETVFDGKFESSYISEMINAVRSFFNGEKQIARFKSKEVARYRTLGTKKSGEDKIVCPGCGSLSTRENLIDGCDYCGTRFTVEDLGTRISDFGLYPDVDVEYKKYKERRSKYGIRVGIIAAIPALLFMIYDTIETLKEWSLLGESMIFDLGVMIIVTVIVVECAVAIAEGAFFVFIFPFLQAKASLEYLGKKALNVLKKSETHNQEAENRIRGYDKHFSLGGFYSNVQNKLAVLHYAETCKEMEAFGEGNSFVDSITDLPKRYENVVNMDVASMLLNNYEINEKFQVMDVIANLKLLVYKKGHISAEDEKVRIRLVKDKNCLTQVVSGPEILTCKQCGASLSLLDGSTCRYCGDVRKLSKYDWSIEDYEIVDKKSYA